MPLLLKPAARESGQNALFPLKLLLVVVLTVVMAVVMAGVVVLVMVVMSVVVKAIPLVMKVILMVVIVKEVKRSSQNPLVKRWPVLLFICLVITSGVVFREVAGAPAGGGAITDRLRHRGSEVRRKKRGNVRMEEGSGRGGRREAMINDHREVMGAGRNEGGGEGGGEEEVRKGKE